jgi:hypothetical protein
MKNWKTVKLLVTLASLLLTSPLYAQSIEDSLEVNPRFNAAVEQSFSTPETWTQEMSPQQGWGIQNPRVLADVNGDKRQDLVGFGTDGVWVAYSTGTGFSPRFVLQDFGYNQAWRVERHTRLLGDIDGDKQADIVGFGNAGVYTSLATRSGFGTVRYIINDLGYDQGWRPDKHVRLLADVNGDGKDDIIAFGEDGVWLSFATGEGNFSPPAFVIQDLGYNQGWRNDRHLRMMADVNGDGKQDIVAFGEQGVFLALSTGSGFEAPHKVLDGFAPANGGWRVDRHPRLLADMNNDGKQDIVGFGNDGVWIALSKGNTFAPMKFVFANFGYNQGWRLPNHPRFIADLNGDGYKDIVGYGQKSVYRALGTATGFDPMRGVLRDLVAERAPFNAPNVNLMNPRFVGDVSGDGLPDLVAVDKIDLKVSKSSTQPPPAAPIAPTGLRITASTANSITIVWNDNSNNERAFLIDWGKSGNLSNTASVAANTTSRTFGNLTGDTSYCFRVQAETLFDVSPSTPQVCGRTSKETFDTTISLVRQQIIEGPVPYVGSFGPIFDGAHLLNINFPSPYPTLLVKPGHSTEECNNSNAVVVVQGDMTAAQKMAIWGTSNITITGNQQLVFVGCTSNPQLPDLIFVNIRWQKP